MERDIELLYAFDFSDFPEADFGSARETPWRDGLPFANGLRSAVEHLQEINGDVTHSDWRYEVYRFQIDLIQRKCLQSFHLETERAITTRLSFPAGGDVVLNPIFYRFDIISVVINYYYLRKFFGDKNIFNFRFQKDVELV